MCEYHHIFPGAILKAKYDKKEINEIANMAFVSGRMNREIGASNPAKYLPAVVAERGNDALTLQAVPMDTSLYQIENYRLFLSTRREILAKLITEFLQKAKSKYVGIGV